MTDAYDANGDMIAREGQRFRQIGWRISGGIKDGKLFSANMSEAEVRAAMENPHGDISAIYVEVGTD